MKRLTVWIYKGSRRAETYLYVPEENDFQRVPEDLLDALGTLELVMQLELDEGRRLARVEAKEIMKGVSQVGYFLQLAPIEPEGERQLQ
ncbi:MAG: YcgL domain-containing protein [Gammaproteobacteria bacterium]|nr:YcgL domain-containing protein [Gammaproteobacteria bacterium]